MSSIPVVFSKFGKSVNDLLKKKYDYDNKFGTRNVIDEWTIESYVTLSEKNVYGGTVKVKHDNKSFGRAEAVLETGGKAEVEVKAKKLMDGLVVTGAIKDAPSAKLGADYRADHFAVAAAVEKTSDAVGLDGSVVVGLEGFSLGGCARYDAPQGNGAKAGALSNYSIGAQYQPNDTVTVSIKTEDQNNDVIGSYFHKLANRTFGLKTVVGGQVKYNLRNTDNNMSLKIGCEHEVDANIRVKGMVESKGLVSWVFEHRLSNPAMKLALASQWDANKRTTKPDRFGVGITFGDTEEASDE